MSRTAATPATTGTMNRAFFGWTIKTIRKEMPNTMIAVLRFSVRKKTQAADRAPQQSTLTIPASVFICFPTWQITTGIKRMTAILASSEGCSC